MAIYTYINEYCAQDDGLLLCKHLNIFRVVRGDRREKLLFRVYESMCLFFLFDNENFLVFSRVGLKEIAQMQKYFNDNNKKRKHCNFLRGIFVLPNNAKISENKDFALTDTI